MVDKAHPAEPLHRSVRHAIQTVETFAAAHGRPVRLISHHLGNAGFRIVLVGDDGTMGDLVLPDLAALKAYTANSQSAVFTTWQTDTAAALTISADRRKKMAGH